MSPSEDNGGLEGGPPDERRGIADEQEGPGTDGCHGGRRSQGL